MNRQERRAAAAGAPTEEVDAKEVYMALLEPIVAGLIQGQKKIVVESRASLELLSELGDIGPSSLVHYTHTLKVVDCGGE